MRTIRVASRKSDLAMTQTRWVIETLLKQKPAWSFEIVPITTKGDRILDVTLSKVGGKGLFVSEIEQAIQSGDADMAVHSMKDVPFELAAALVIGGIPEREDPRDVFVSTQASTLDGLPEGAVVGTSSLRRMAQLRRLRQDISVVPLRGNIDTRLRRAEAGDFDAILLAAAGLHRMGWAGRVTDYLSTEACVPAIGQGALAVECRENDIELREILTTWSHPDTVAAVTAERALLQALQGSCQVPIAGYAIVLGDGRLQLTGLVADPDGFDIVKTTRTGRDALELGREVAAELKSGGAAEWIRAAMELAGQNE